MSLAMIQKVVADQSLSNPIDKLVMLILAHHWNPEHGCFPSVPTIAREASLTERCVYGVVKRLGAGGYISKISTLGRVNRYMFYTQCGENNVQTLATPASDTPLHVAAPTPEYDSTTPLNVVQGTPEPDNTLTVSNGKRNVMKLTVTTTNDFSASADAGEKDHSSDNRIEEHMQALSVQISQWSQEFGKIDVVQAVRKCITHNLASGQPITAARVKGWLDRERQESQPKAPSAKTSPSGKIKPEYMPANEVVEKYKDKIRGMPPVYAKAIDSDDEVNDRMVKAIKAAVGRSVETDWDEVFNIVICKDHFITFGRNAEHGKGADWIPAQEKAAA